MATRRSWFRDRQYARTGEGNTDCVNFQVGEFGSPSTIFYDPAGREEFLDNNCMIWSLLLVEETVCRT